MIFKFSAEWCQPCKQLTKILAEAGIPVEEIDIDKAQDVVVAFDIRSVPTLVHSETGEKLIGVKTAKEIKDWVAKCESL